MRLFRSNSRPAAGPSSRPLDLDMFDSLPFDTKETCDVSDFGWVAAGTAAAEDPNVNRCGRRASFMKSGSCNCGMCEVNHRHCAGHHADYERGVMWIDDPDFGRRRSSVSDELN